MRLLKLVSNSPSSMSGDTLRPFFHAFQLAISREIVYRTLVAWTGDWDKHLTQVFFIILYCCIIHRTRLVTRDMMRDCSCFVGLGHHFT
jgi:hypothetical protein